MDILRNLPNRGVFVYDENWDNLIILDACRFDTFKELNAIDGKLESRISRGSATPDFLLENFSKHPTRSSFKDVVYVAGNPFVNWLLQDKFYKIYPVWDYGWDENLLTVTPEKVVAEALKARRQYQDKRLIIHFMQPHFPPLVGRPKGDTGIAGMRKAARENIDIDPFTFVKRKGVSPEFWDTTCDGLLARGELSKQEVVALYKENLRIVLSHVTDLVKQLPGTTVVSSDHGNLFGERPGLAYPFTTYGHPRRLRVGRLIQVPWLIVVNQEIEMSKAEQPAEEKDTFSQEDDEKIKDRLQKLGYL